MSPPPEAVEELTKLLERLADYIFDEESYTCAVYDNALIINLRCGTQIALIPATMNQRIEL